MFWIGLIVGIAFMVMASFAFFMFCLWATGTSLEEFEGVVYANAAAFGNRESTIQVWHDGEVVNEFTLKEKE